MTLGNFPVMLYYVKFVMQLGMIFQLQVHFNSILKLSKLQQVIFTTLTSLVMVDLVKFTRYSVCARNLTRK